MAAGGGEEAVVELVTADNRAICMQPRTGNIIGSSEGPMFFQRAFSKGLDEYEAREE